VILGGDIGGTKTLLGLFEPQPSRPRPVTTRSYLTGDYPDLQTIIGVFLKEAGTPQAAVEAACFGVAGPVVGDRHESARLTNRDWPIDGRLVAASLGLKRVRLLNDLMAMAYAIPVLDEADLLTLQPGKAQASGDIAVIAAGTGLGEAVLHRQGGRLVPWPSEGGHADFAARNESEIRVLRWLIDEYGRAQVERVVSGSGLVNLHRVIHDAACGAVRDLTRPGAPAAITRAALHGRCASCRQALTMFVEAYGAEAGNLALRSLSTGGLFVGGGIAPKILPALTNGAFIEAFVSKAPFESLLEAMPVKVILTTDNGLLGAAVYAARHER
jgi:glucokinase